LRPSPPRHRLVTASSPLRNRFRGARARRAAQLALGIALLYLYRSARREIEAERRSGSARSKAELPELARTDSVASIHML
jgi:hypothetical protein